MSARLAAAAALALALALAGCAKKEPAAPPAAAPAPAPAPAAPAKTEAAAPAKTEAAPAAPAAKDAKAAPASEAGKEAAPPAPASALEGKGKVRLTALDAGKIEIADSEGALLTFTLAKDAKVTRLGKEAKLADFQPQDAVRYAMSPADPGVLTRLEGTEAAPPPAP